MTVLIKPQLIERGKPIQLTLVQSDLIPLISDEYFKDQTIWSRVDLVYKSTVGTQVKTVPFIQPNSIGYLTLSAKSMESFTIFKVVINDFDGGTVTIGRSNLPVGFMDIVVTPQPIVSLISPIEWSALGGGTATISGKNFESDSEVTLVNYVNGQRISCTELMAGPTSIQIEIPQYAPNKINVEVANKVGSKGSLSNCFTYVNTSVLDNSPKEGTTNGNDLFTITGEGFFGTATVEFNGIQASECIVVNKSTITCKVPPQMTLGQANIVLKLNGKQVQSSMSYNYISAIVNPTVTSLSKNMWTTAGTSQDKLSIYGTDFQIGATVKLVSSSDGTTYNCFINSVTSTEININIPSNTVAHIMNAVVTNIDGGIGLLSNCFTYIESSVSGLSKVQLLESGGESITISGNGFLGSAQVNIGGNSATSCIIKNQNEITCVTPAGTVGNTEIVVIINGAAIYNNTIQYISAPAAFLKVSNSANICQILANKIDEFGNSYVAGTFTGAVSLAFGSKSTQGYSSAQNFFAAKFDASGNCLWIKSQESLTTNSLSYSITNIQIDGNGDVCVGLSIYGITVGSKFSFGGIAKTFTTAGSGYAYGVIRFNSDLVVNNVFFTKSTNYTGALRDFIVDNSNNYYMVSTIGSPSVAGDYSFSQDVSLTLGATYNHVIFKFSNAGVLLWANQITTTSSTFGVTSLSTDSSNNLICIIGSSSAYTVAYKGGSYSYTASAQRSTLLKIAPDSSFIKISGYTPTSTCLFLCSSRIFKDSSGNFYAAFNQGPASVTWDISLPSQGYSKPVLLKFDSNLTIMSNIMSAYTATGHLMSSDTGVYIDKNDNIFVRIAPSVSASVNFGTGLINVPIGVTVIKYNQAKNILAYKTITSNIQPQCFGFAYINNLFYSSISFWNKTDSLTTSKGSTASYSNYGYSVVFAD